MDPLRNFFLLLVVLCTVALASCQEEGTAHHLSCSMKFFDSTALIAPRNSTVPVEDGESVCVLVEASQNPEECYNITLTRVTICTATHQYLLPGDPNDPEHTGCNTPLSAGVMIQNVIYDVDRPGELLSTYDAHFTPMTELGPQNFIGFCYDSKLITPYNNIVQVEYSYEESQCVQDEHCWS